MSVEFSRQPYITEIPGPNDEAGVRKVQYVVKGDIREETDDTKDKKLAWVKLKIYDGPIRVCLVRDLHVECSARRNKLSSMLMRQVEHKIRDEGAIGILRNHVGAYEGTPQEAKGMYERHGWYPFSREENILAFNVGNDPQRREIANKMYLNMITLDSWRTKKEKAA